MGTVLAPKAHKNVDLHLVPSVKDVGEIGTFDWYAYVLEELGDAVSKWRSKDLKNVGGCMLFLQLVYFHRLTWQSLKASSEIPLIQHWDTKHLRTRVEEERKAAEEMKGRYGLGEWDTTTYPIGRERILVAKKEKIPIIELSQSGHGRTVTYRVPDDLLTNEEIRQQAKNECEVDSMLIKRDQEIHSRLTIERVTRIKMNALKLSEKEKEKEAAGEENGVGDISFTQLVADDEVMRSCDDLVARMMEATNAAKEMPSFDLGINDEGFNRFRNISPPRKNMGLVRVRVRRKNGGNKKT
ncbi:uncharacterized protein LOC141591111 [Silene latifolia]|uniref:uncharacterized protein LOC141591111 n=1 Tax=Silene latifolia TaxID=37657 RepID=UPI003D7831AC